MKTKSNTPCPKQNADSIETIAGQIMALQMLLEAIIIDGVRSGTLSSDLLTATVKQGIEVFPKNTHLSKSELFGAIGTLNSVRDALIVAKSGKIP